MIAAEKQAKRNNSRFSATAHSGRRCLIRDDAFHNRRRPSVLASGMHCRRSGPEWASAHGLAVASLLRCVPRPVATTVAAAERRGERRGAGKRQSDTDQVDAGHGRIVARIAAARQAPVARPARRRSVAGAAPQPRAVSVERTQEVFTSRRRGEKNNSARVPIMYRLAHRMTRRDGHEDVSCRNHQAVALRQRRLRHPVVEGLDSLEFNGLPLCDRTRLRGTASLGRGRRDRSRRL